MFKKKQVLQIEATGEATAGAVLSLDFAPGKLESQVCVAILSTAPEPCSSGCAHQPQHTCNNGA